MNKTKKLKLYEFNPRFFSDFSRDGIGDFKGLYKKIDYFKYLGVDAILLQNVLSSGSDDSVQHFNDVASDLGKIKDLKAVIAKGKKQGTKVFLEIGIGSIKESHKWFADSASKQDGIVDFQDKKDVKDTKDSKDSKDKKLEATVEMKYSKAAKGYYAVDSATQVVPLNWKSEKVMTEFVKVIRLWKNLGVEGFVFKGFEYLTDPERTDLMSADTLKQLRKFFLAIKEIDDNVVVIGKSALVDISATNQYTEGSTKVFDYFMVEQISLLGTSEKFGNDQLGKFKLVNLINSIRSFAKDPSNILSFGSQLSGRINSRWGNHGQYSAESAKALGLLLAATPATFSIYYGDEIGALNIGLTHLDNFQDATLVERRKKLAVRGRVKEVAFMKAQVLQNPINSRSLMAWNSEKNGGFSEAEKTITPVSTTYKEINVENQFTDKASTLNFYIKLLKLVSNPKLSKVIINGKFKISILMSGAVKISSELGSQEVITYINLSEKPKGISRVKHGQVLASSYAHKTYAKTPNSLEAFEAVMISKGIKVQEPKTSKVDKTQEVSMKAKAEKTQEVSTKKEKAEKTQEVSTKKEKAEKTQEVSTKAKADKTQEVSTKKEKADKTQEVSTKKEKADKTQEVSTKKAKAEKTQEVSTKENASLTKTVNLKLEKAVEETNELSLIKEAAKAERAASKMLKKDENKFSIMEEEILENERTSLTEEDIAPTTQIDTDKIDDFEAFLNESKK